MLRVGDGNTPNATGAYTWVPFTDANGAALPGALTITDPNGVTSVDARNTTNLAAVQGHRLPAPRGHADPDGAVASSTSYVTTTTTNEVYGLDLENQTISRLRQPEHHRPRHRRCRWASALASPDNLAIDHEGNIYIIEDRNGGVDDDIWFARDLNKDGDLTDAGEGIGALGVERHGGLGVHRPVLRPDRQAPGLGQHPASGQRQRPDDRDHDPAPGRSLRRRE